MISFPAGSEIFVLHEPVSFGRGIDGMCALCRIILRKEPLSSAYFLFLSKTRMQVRALWYDGQGFSLCTKRLSKGTFQHWPGKSSEGFSSVNWYAAQSLFSGGTVSDNSRIWKKIS